MNRLKILLTVILLTALCCGGALAEVPSREPVNFLENTQAPTPAAKAPAEMKPSSEASAAPSSEAQDAAIAPSPEAEAATEVPAPTLAPTPAPAEAGSFAKDDDGIIRVLLLSLGAPKELNLRFAGDYAVEGDPGFRFGADARLTAFVHEGSVWFDAGGLKVDMGESVTLTRHCSEGLFLEESEKNAAYVGDLTLSVSGEALRPVLAIGVEDYLCGVVAYEMSDSFPVEALKAQAVAARTYAMQRKYAAGKRDYDVMDTTADQVYKGFDPAYTNVIEAVEATRGVVGVYNGAFAACYYTASNGGQVACPNDIWGGRGDDDYIEMHDDPYDLENPHSLVNSLTFAKDLSDNAALKQLLASKLEDGAEPVSVEAVTPESPKTEGSRMYTKLRFDLTVLVEAPEAEPTPRPLVNFSLKGLLGMPGPGPELVEEQVSVTLDVYGEIKDGFSLGLNGSDYELISVTGDEASFTLEMRRFGHGVGMSQRGAQWMAGEYGKTWREILNFYYPGMELAELDWQHGGFTSLEGLPTIHGYRRPEPTPRPTPKPLPALEDGQYYACVALSDTSSALNVRQEPNTGAMILDRFENGRRLIVTSGPDENGWVQILTGELEGYVKLEYLKAE